MYKRQIQLYTEFSGAMDIVRGSAQIFSVNLPENFRQPFFCLLYTSITVTVPKAKILSHEIDEKSIEVFDETKNIFNQISITDYHQFAIDQKEKMETNVKEKGLIEEAQKKAETTIKTFITSSNRLSDDYEIVFKVSE